MQKAIARAETVAPSPMNFYNKTSLMNRANVKTSSMKGINDLQAGKYSQVKAKAR